jgi:hypothetical protein
VLDRRVLGARVNQMLQLVPRRFFSAQSSSFPIRNDHTWRCVKTFCCRVIALIRQNPVRSAFS